MTDWLLLQDGTIVYVILFLALMGGAIGLPIPEDIPLIFGGVLAHRGQGDIKVILIVCYSAILLGDIVIYLIGRKLGTGIFQTRWFKKRMTQSRLRKIKLRMEKRSLLMIFIARHLFYLRTVTFLTCGAVKMRVGTFILADALAALISVPLMTGLGYFASEHIEALLRYIHKVKELSLIGGVLLLAVGYLYWRRRRRAKLVDDEAEVEVEEEGKVEDLL